MRRPSSRTRPAAMRNAGAGFADNPEHLARRDRKADIVDRGQHAAPARHLDPQMLDLQQRLDICRHRSFGLSASRSQSPSRFTDKIKIASTIPGKIEIHQSPDSR